MPILILRSSAAQGGALYSGYTPTIYAAPADVGSGDGSSEANAMDLPTALSTVTAGGIVGLIPGTYTGTPSGNAPIFGPANAGSSGNPIVICCKYPAMYNIANTALLSEFRSNDPFIGSGDPDDPDWSTNSPVLGNNDKNYIEIYGPYANMTYAPPRPSHGTFKLNAGTGCVFADWACDQIALPNGDNFNALFMQLVPSATVKRFYVRGGTDTGNHNAAAITTYGCLNFVIEYGTFEDVHQCIFVKGSASSNTVGNSGYIRYCKSLDAGARFVDVAVVKASSEAAGNKVYVHNNLSVRDGIDVGTAVAFDSSGEGCRDVEFYHNTVVAGATGGGVYGKSTVMEGMVFRDNVIVFTASSANHPLNLEGTAASAFTTLNYNLYSEAGQTAVFAELGSTYSGIAAWRTQTGKEAQSSETAPAFDAGVDNYKRTGSGDTGSSTGGVRGCYQTGNETIGDGVH